MATQAGTFHITGCIDNLCFYKMDGKYYVRMKSSLTGKRVKKDPRFKRTMQYAGLLANASKIASALYKALPKESKGIAVYRMITGKAMKLLQEGKNADEIVYLRSCSSTVKAEKNGIKKIEKPLLSPYRYADALIAKVFAGSSQKDVRALSLDEAPP